jgi:asparagine synthetase B (glutamine-hydrolysing)
MSLRLLGKLDVNLGWDGSTLYRDQDFDLGMAPNPTVRGAVASVRGDRCGNWQLVRDPLGINKLFWVRDADAAIVIASRPKPLVDAGHALDEIQALPRGVAVALVPGQDSRSRAIAPIERTASAEARSGIDTIAAEIRSVLDRYLARLASAYPHVRAYVCLSGGIDSSGIAALVRKHFPDSVAVSFDIEHGSGPSDDRLMAERVAGDLGLPLLRATVTPETLLEKIDTVLTEGIDWRDFNVHAALVNAALAERIAEDTLDHDGAALVFTGDLANEFLADYQPEHYGAGTYYRLPRLEPGALRSHLVRGLDTCHREVGVFAAWNLPVVQPYAVAVEAYLAIPPDWLARPDCKQELSRAIFGELLPEYVYSRKKVRAQLGSANGDGGVLALCLNRGIDGAALRRRFAALHRVDDLRALDRFIRAGSYRSALPSLKGTPP